MEGTKMTKNATKYAIENQMNGKFYIGMTGIGPALGGNKKEAKLFDSIADASREMGRHWAFTTCEIIPAKWLKATR
jgi:hypothetical protein